MMGQGYGSNPLLDMRIHDINVEAEILRNIPQIPDPDGADGTAKGATETDDSAVEEQSFLNDLNNLLEQLVWWWEGWWPRIHTMISFSSPAGGSTLMHVSVDILLDFQVEDLRLDTPVDDQMTANQKEEWSHQVSSAALTEEGELEDFFRGLTGVLLFSFAVFCGTILAFNNPAVTAAFIGIMIVEYLAWLVGMWLAMKLGLISQEFVVGILTLWFWAVVGTATSAITIMILVAIVNWATSLKPPEWMTARIYYGILILIFQFALIAMAWFALVTVTESSIQNYMEFR
jgi:hypothetical protein